MNTTKNLITASRSYASYQQFAALAIIMAAMDNQEDQELAVKLWARANEHLADAHKKSSN